MTTLKVSVTTMSTINDEIKTSRSVISSSSTVNISAESNSDHQQTDINTQTILTSTTTTSTSSEESETGPKSQAKEAHEPGLGHRYKTTKAKIYRVKNVNWYCKNCDIYCNSTQQFEVHMISQKHKMALSSSTLTELTAGVNKMSVTSQETCTLAIKAANGDVEEPRRIKSQSESEAEEDPKKKALNPIIEFNLIASQCNIDATKYLIPQAKKKGKFEKFGFYCSKCDAYMTGQIQLVMHVRGAKHQYFSPNEIPDYKPSKVYNPNQKQERRIKYVSQRTNFFKAIRDGGNLTYFFNQNMSSSAAFYKNYFYNQIMANTSICNKTTLNKFQRNSCGGSKKMSFLNEINRDYQFDMCFYDYFFRTQELIHNQNYHRYNYEPLGPMSYATRGSYSPASMFEESSQASTPCADAVNKPYAGGSIDGSSDYDQSSWSSYSGSATPNPYLGQFQAQQQQQQPYYSVSGYGSADSLHQTYQAADANNNYFTVNLNSVPKPDDANFSYQQNSQMSRVTNESYHMVSKSHSGKLVQISPNPSLNNGVSMLVMNTESINANQFSSPLKPVSFSSPKQYTDSTRPGVDVYYQPSYFPSPYMASSGNVAFQQPNYQFIPAAKTYEDMSTSNGTSGNISYIHHAVY